MIKKPLGITQRLFFDSLVFGSIWKRFFELRKLMMENGVFSRFYIYLKLRGIQSECSNNLLF
jgi:hypothetical protein